MNKELLLQIFKSAYNRQSFIDNVLLPTVQGKVDKLEIYDQHGVQEIELTSSEEQFAKSAIKYGEFTTKDEIGRTVELYEVILHDHKQVERSRVGIAALIKKQIIGNNAVLVNFAYEKTQNRSWRFSFIAHDAIFTDGEMVQSDTSPKRYTYVFGEADETYRTALERFYTLGHEYVITVSLLKDAFGVEAMSKAFFDEYRDTHYNGFVDYLTRSNFKQSVFNGDEKAIRDFVKKLLGRIVFLYFIQKKGWLGASNGQYKDGDRNFMSNFFKQAGANEAFYANWLSKLFFDTLNNPRANDSFEMPDGSIVYIPYLNGGLFEKESQQYDFLTFSSDLFSDLFEFFDQYNFTIYEDSPEEHTVAVDPEMLGHIFENLLEDNKDKGAFYTPKEIVHYMTQESLIEYLHTQIPEANRVDLEAFVKNKTSNLSNDLKKVIDQKLDTVKICDPAIGSGAFPMGLLQEIFGIKERIAFELGFKVWSPATVKEHIIQNSIYGVDIEKGAVDIARLRFWLSLIVDEEMPKALPNLDYKIVVGNSLVSKFEDLVIDINWSKNKTTSSTKKDTERLQKALKSISAKQKDFFVAESNIKNKLRAEIRNLKLEILTRQITLDRNYYFANNPEKGGFSPSPKEHKFNVERKIKLAEYDDTLARLKKLKTTDQAFKHFDWKLDFPEVLNPLAIEKTGFDIVIGNPPYIKEATNKEAFLDLKNHELYQGKMDLWYLFGHLGIELSRDQGVSCFIATNNWVTNDGASLFRNYILENSKILQFVDFGDFKVFVTAGIQTMIYLIKKSSIGNESIVKYSRLNENKVSMNELKKFLQLDINSPQWIKKNLEFSPSDYLDRYITFSNSNLLKTISKNANAFISSDEVFSGVDVLQDFVSKRSLSKIDDKHNVAINDGVFVLSDLELEKLDLSKNESSVIKPYFTTKEVSRNKFDAKNKYWLIYSDKKVFKNIESFPTIRKHLDKFEPIMTSVNKPYGLHRSRSENNFLGEKILCTRKCSSPSFAFTNSDTFVSRAFLIIKSSRFNQKYLATVLNSRLVKYWLKNKGKLQGNNFQIDKTPLLEIPLINKFDCTAYESICDYAILLNNLDEQLCKKTNGQIIIEALDEIVDALVFELYFENDFKSKCIEIEKHTKDLFKPLDGLTDDQKLEQINAIYDEYSKKENSLRNQIKLMKIELKDLLLPILSV